MQIALSTYDEIGAIHFDTLQARFTSSADIMRVYLFNNSKQQSLSWLSGHRMHAIEFTLHMKITFGRFTLDLSVLSAMKFKSKFTDESNFVFASEFVFIKHQFEFCFAQFPQIFLYVYEGNIEVEK